MPFRNSSKTACYVIVGTFYVSDQTGKPSTLAWITIRHFIISWFPSRCHTAFGKGIVYARRLITDDCLLIVFAWSTHCMAAHNISLGTFIPLCSKCPWIITLPHDEWDSLIPFKAISRSVSEIAVNLHESIPNSCNHLYNVCLDASRISAIFLNQAHAGLRLACTWFLEIAFVHDVGMHVCVRPRGYKLHSRDIEPVQPAEQVCCF